MASWFESAAQSLGNFVTGHGLQDNAQRAIADAQEAERKKREQEQQRQANQTPVIQQRLNANPVDNASLKLPTPSATLQPAQPVIQQPTQPKPQNLTFPKPQPTISGMPMLPSATLPKAPTQQVQVQPAKPNMFQNIGNFFSDAAKNTGGMISDFGKNTSGMVNDFFTDPNNVPRNVLDYITGTNNPLDGATYDYQHKTADGKPTLVPKAQPKNLQEFSSQSLLGDILNELLIKPTVQAAPRLYNTVTSQDATALPQWIQDANKGLGYNNEDLNSSYKPDADGTTHPILGTVETVGDAATLIPIIGGLLKGFTKGVSKTGRAINGVTDGVNSVDEAAGLSGAARNTEKTIPTTVTDPQLLLPENASTPRPNGVISSDGPSGFVIKTPAQVAETKRAIGDIKKIDTKLNVIRQGETNTISAPEVRSLMKKREDLLSVATGDKTMQQVTTPDGLAINPAEMSPTTAISDTTTPLTGPDLGVPGANPIDATISATPTRDQLAGIVDNTVNPVAPNAPKIKLTAQNEMADVTQKSADNFTGELGVNKNGQIYQKVDQARAHDTAVKNLLDGKTPEEYLATARQTGEADSAELAILMEQTPKDSPVWAELASLKGKLGTQKGQALALLERTMRQSATSEQLASRTLQKANTAGFDTTQIASDISRINKGFTDARDAYNTVLNTPGATNAEVQAAKDAFFRVTKQSFTDESNILNKIAKTKEQKNLAYQLQKKSDVYLQGMATSSLTSSPTSVLRNFTQGVGALAHQAALAPKVEALINRMGGGAKVGSFDAAGAKVGFKTGANNLKGEFATRASQLDLTKDPRSWLKHPINTIRQLTTTGTELGNIPMEGAIRGGMSSEYKQILKAQGFDGDELKMLTERNTITDPLNIRTKYAKEINDLNGLSSEVDRTGGTFRDSLKNQFIKMGTTDKTAFQLADFVDRDIFGFFKPTLIVGKKTADYATGGVAHLVPAIVKLSRGDKAGFVSEISKTIATAGVTLPVWGATGYALAKAGVLTQNEYGEWQIGNVPISGYVGAFGGPMAMGAIAGENQANDRPAFDGFVDKAYKTIVNTYPYGQAGQKLGAVADVAGGVFGNIANGQQAYGFKEGVASLLGGLGKEAIPASSFLNMLNKMLGGNVKSTVIDNPKDATALEAGMTGVAQAGTQIMAGLPGVSNLLPDKKNSFGETIKKPEPIPALFGASNDSIKQSDAATGITAVGSNDLNSVAKDNLTTVDDKTAYNNAIKTIQDAGDDVTDTNVFKELSKSGNYLLASKYDSDINQSINDADKISLAKYNALDADHQKVYVQDNKNALDTYTAQLNNKQANGTLSQDDTKTYKVWSGSGNSLLVNALVAKTNVEHNVSTDTLNLYEQVTTQKEYNSLSAEQKAAIDTYATQLKANGVNVRSFLAGGGGDGGSKAKGASSVPLTKAVTSGGGVGGKFAHQDINIDIPQVVKPAPQYVIKQRKISVG